MIQLTHNYIVINKRTLKKNNCKIQMFYSTLKKKSINYAK